MVVGEYRGEARRVPVVVWLGMESGAATGWLDKVRGFDPGCGARAGALFRLRGVW